MGRTFGFAALVAAFIVVAGYFGALDRLKDHLPSAIASFALLLAPYYAFGMGPVPDAIKALGQPAKIALAGLAVAPYPIFSVPRHDFHTEILAGFLAVIYGVAVLLSLKRGWADWSALLLLAGAVELHWFDRAWPVPGMSGMPKLLLLDAALYGFLAIRELDGIGFDFRPRWSDLRIGLREFALYAPVALALGLALGFLHVHKTLANPLWFGSGWLFTLFFIAVPEEFFFRGVMLNLLERRVGARTALIATSVLFGLAHFNKRAAFFNWRYVALAAIAGWFYGRAWVASRRVLTASITHATIDTVWSIWLR